MTPFDGGYRLSRLIPLVGRTFMRPPAYNEQLSVSCMSNMFHKGCMTWALTKGPDQIQRQNDLGSHKVVRFPSHDYWSSQLGNLTTQ